MSKLSSHLWPKNSSKSVDDLIKGARKHLKNSRFQEALDIAQDIQNTCGATPDSIEIALRAAAELPVSVELGTYLLLQANEALPEEPRLSGYIGRYLSKKGFFERAQPYLDSALELQQDKPSLIRATAANLIELHKEGNETALNKAEKYVQTALRSKGHKEDPKVQIYIAAADLCLALDDIDKAKSYAHQASELKPKNTAVLSLLEKIRLEDLAASDCGQGMGGIIAHLNKLNQ